MERYFRFITNKVKSGCFYSEPEEKRTARPYKGETPNKEE